MRQRREVEAWLPFSAEMILVGAMILGLAVVLGFGAWIVVGHLTGWWTWTPG